METRTDPAMRFVTEAKYAELRSLARQTLSNWRYRDRMAGRNHALPGYPTYRYFGTAVRYVLEDADAIRGLLDTQGAAEVSRP